MAKHKYDVVATVGKYEKNGETKYISRKVGAVIQTDKGFRMKMDAFFNPAGCKVDEDDSIWLALFEPPDSDAQKKAQRPPPHTRHTYHAHTNCKKHLRRKRE